MLTMATVKQATKCSGGGKQMKYRATPWEDHPAGAFYCQVCGGAFDLGPRAPSHEIQEPHPLSWVHEFRQQLASTAVATSYEDKLAEAEEIRAKQDPNLYGAYRDALPTCENCGEVLDGVDSVQMSGSVGSGCNHCVPESEW